ncbi:uncharacterized protein LOC131223396 isoform X2 [Magnolia sinica]|uniref:uncharacterized protein LOC131223396 isoform X2 n=1 Tax=Magnolia sinica TaxID=86752 RepID=UPI0026582E1D|nr:uncharacterized protein LOC131223396 isoform X2 [Magnolia sinica]XP_058074792.1 uncharacterized protein LOC131223396 isoform X2 [Magnolia sinica]
MAAINVVKARQIFDGRGNRNVECYYDTSKATDELVQKILLTGLEPGAVDVFLDFICYSGGPLPDELLTQVKEVHVSEDFVAEQLGSMLSDM